MFLRSELFVFAYIIIAFLSLSCIKANKNYPKTNDIIYDINFDGVEDLRYFKIETEINANEVTIKNGALDIDAIKGATVWLKDKLTAPIKIEYTAIVLNEGGPNDRVSDLNCFFMAIDPMCPSNITSCADSIRTGRFRDYHRLRTYYVGYGGHDNTTTRMRRYIGYTGERPVLEEHDIGFPEIIKPNEPIRVKIRVLGNIITYSHNDKIIFTMNDTLPYNEGWFAFRTVRNHLQIQDLKITELKP